MPLSFDDLTDSDKLARVLLYATRRAATVAEEAVNDYPPPRNTTMKAVRGVTFVSAKQRGYFFWALKKGIIKLPYNRTGGLGQSITTDVFARTGLTGFHIGTNKPHAEYVIGEKDDQAAYHQDWWTPLPDNVRQHKDAIRAEYIKSVKAGLT